MGLAALYNTWGSPQALAEWSFNHASHHRDIIRFVFDQQQVQLPEFPLDPMDPDNLTFWEYQHQLMHLQMNSVLGIAGQNLTGVDWNDFEQLSEFLDANASEHLQANTILRIP